MRNNYNNPYINFDAEDNTFNLYDLSKDAYYAAKDYYTSKYFDRDDYYKSSKYFYE